MLYGKKSGATSYSELVEIKDVPDMGSDPEQIEVTTLKDTIKKYIKGRKDSPVQSYTYNYTEANYTAVKEYCTGDINYYIVKFADGSGVAIKGGADTYVKGFGTNAPVEAVLSITPEDIEMKTSTEITALLTTAG